jgi:hypothetical protein
MIMNIQVDTNLNEDINNLYRIAFDLYSKIHPGCMMLVEKRKKINDNDLKSKLQ